MVSGPRRPAPTAEHEAASYKPGPPPGRSIARVHPSGPLDAPPRAPRRGEPDSPRLLADLFENSAIGMHLQDPEGVIQLANPALEAMLGYPPGELEGRSAHEIHTDSRVASQIMDRLASGEPITNLEVTLAARDGTRREVLISANALREAGRFVYARFFTRDVTEQRCAQRDLADVAARYHAILEAALDAIVTMDASGRLVDFNGAAERIFGYRREEALGRSLAQLIIPASLREAHERGLRHYLHTGEGPVLGKRLETVAHDAAGREFPVELSIAVVGLDPPLFTATVRDISARRRGEQELQRALESLREADRRKDEFIATLGHELRNPLAPVRNAASLLTMPGIAPQQVGWAAGIIQRQVGHMARLLDDLLDVARVTSGKLEVQKGPVVLDEVVGFAVEIARPQIQEKSQQLHLQLPQPPVQFQADSARISQVLANLLTNASKYSDAGAQVWLRAWRDGAMLSIEVRDEGIGFEPGDAERLFAMFAQMPAGRARDEGGLGIGLALARALVELHGGTLQARSEGPGRGSSFVVTLPLE